MKKLLLLATLFIFTITIQAQDKKELTLEDAILKGRSSLAPENRIDLKIIPGTTDYVYVASNYQSLIKGSFNSDAEDTIVELGDVNASLPEGIKRSHLYGMQWTSANSFGFLTKGKMFVYDYKAKSASAVLEYGAENSNTKIHLESKQVAFTKDNNIGVAIPGSGALMITENKDLNIVSGQAIARSEFGITEGIFWSPEGNHIAFYQKDESKVGDYPLLDVTTTPGSLKNIKYPMAGQGSEVSTVGIYTVASKNLIYVQSPIEEADHYYTNVSWSADEKYVLIAEINRDQNHVWLNQYSALDGSFVKTLWEETHDTWVEPEHPAHFLNKSEFVWVSEKDGFMNMYLVNLESGKTSQITKNKWETTSIIGHNGSTIYFTGTGENPTESHTFKVSKKGGSVKNLTTEAGTHSTTFSSDYNYFIDNYSSTSVPRIVKIKSSKGKTVKTLLTAENPLKDYNISMPEISTIKSADGVTDLYTRMIKPTDFDPNKKYPVIVYVYGGPHAQMITNRWMASAAMWMYYQAEKGYIIYTVDNRGSAHRGFEFENTIHRNLGDAEMDDQLKGVEFLKSLPFVDADRMAVHGWSYGGFMTTSLMLRQPGTFKVGVAGGPVTDWSYYEIMYGERYMDRPEQNEEGYEKNRLMNHVEGLEGDLLLIHGTIDNVVVMQHNLALVKAFVDAGIQMDFFPYPMHEHNVRGKDRIHLMRKVLTYIEDKLD
jgi:dipeptidyl-peptidase-4